MSILSLSSGYGGLELAIQAAFGPQTIDAVCDNYKPARQVLAHHHPAAAIHDDVNDPNLLDYKSYIVAFGFPCQDLSRAGKQAGLNGTRSGLFYACMNVVRAVQPTEVIVENVPQAEKYANAINQMTWRTTDPSHASNAKHHPPSPRTTERHTAHPNVAAQPAPHNARSGAKQIQSESKTTTSAAATSMCRKRKATNPRRARSAAPHSPPLEAAVSTVQTNAAARRSKSKDNNGMKATQRQ